MVEEFLISFGIVRIKEIYMQGKMALASLFLLVLPKWCSCEILTQRTIHLHLELRAEGPRREAKIYLKDKR